MLERSRSRLLFYESWGSSPESKKSTIMAAQPAGIDLVMLFIFNKNGGTDASAYPRLWALITAAAVFEAGNTFINLLNLKLKKKKLITIFETNYY